MPYIEEQIRYVEDCIAIKKSLGKDYRFEADLIKAWKEWLPGGSKHHLWVKYSREGSHQKQFA